MSKTEIEAQREVRLVSLQQYKTERYRMLSETTQLEKNIRDIRRKSQDSQSRLHDLQMSKARFEFEYENNRQHLFDTYDLNWGIARQSYTLKEDVETAEEELTQCREDMRLMGTVNVAAIEEYQKVSERFNFLNKQALDLEEAQTALRGVIEEMDITMRKQFLEAFQAIGREFMTVFGELFGGGFAELQLLDKENVLESGIEIIAQPPGKKLQQLSLLSGGERALTVIALLFSILRVRPTPFCVVDEIDAALDEANVSRFARFLSNLAKNSQFVVITHRKTTMEYANVMHGITMEEEGVSKLISVKFAEQAS
jgi:chromosome segregation protein